MTKWVYGFGGGKAEGHAGMKGLLGGTSNTQISLIGQNLFTITKYSGLDPEVAGGIDNNIYPRPRILSFGLNVSF